ncbi:RimJ/RimL family protein N-acetyltransferase [Xanthomonas sacchari]|uniref:GNAT family N-acetyltransferase n=1 Tax=Xanthomonas sacchari TaxID=56458 RepID=UPI0020C4DEAD|nr:GNAT family N-acetyltransferase [Xanthomonas sacchari]MDQ1092888.1 RimJ/RimL family protein N-acetyltransferase [Xanthomonas sacchari]
MSVFDVRVETERLLLRPPCAEDFAAFCAFAADAQTMHHLGGVQVPSVAWRGLAAMVGSWQLQGFAMFSVIEKRSGQWIGRVGPWQPHGWPGTEVGWGIARAYWGHGYAPEAAAASIDWAFAHLGWSEVIHVIAPDNANSKAVAGKLGSRYLRPGQLPEPLAQEPIEVWGQSRAHWQARR